MTLELKNVVKRVGAETHIFDTSLTLAAEGRYTEATTHMLRAAAIDPASSITADNLAALLAAGASRDR